MFSQIATFAALAAAVSASYNASSVSTVFDIGTTVVSIESCAHNACKTVPVTTGVTVYTTTISGVETVYTTYCPLTSEAPAPSPAPAHNTTSPTPATISTGAANKLVAGAAAIAGVAGVLLL